MYDTSESDHHNIWCIIQFQNNSRRTLIDYLLSTTNFASALPILESVNHDSDMSRFLVGVTFFLAFYLHCIFWSCAKLFSSVQFSRSVVSDSLRPHKSQHIRPPCPSPTPGVYSDSCLLSQWCHPAISSSVVPFSSHTQSLPASGSFRINQLFTWGGQNIGVSASASVLPMNTQYWSPLGWTGWITLQSKGLSRVFSNTTVQKHQFFSAQLSL